VLRRGDAAGPHMCTQQILAAEPVRRQIAAVGAVAVEKTVLHLAVQRVASGVNVQHQILGRGLEAGDELLHQHPVQPHRRGTVGPVLQPPQRGGAGDRYSLDSALAARASRPGTSIHGHAKGHADLASTDLGETSGLAPNACTRFLLMKARVYLGVRFVRALCLRSQSCIQMRSRPSDRVKRRSKSLGRASVQYRSRR
jgi:hypothetical protein